MNVEGYREILALHVTSAPATAWGIPRVRQLRAVHIFARGLVGERAIDDDPIKLPSDVLVEDADSGIGDSLPGDGTRVRTATWQLTTTHPGVAYERRWWRTPVPLLETRVG